jgi:hypothetical protein
MTIETTRERARLKEAAHTAELLGPLVQAAMHSLNHLGIIGPDDPEEEADWWARVEPTLRKPALKAPATISGAEPTDWDFDPVQAHLPPRILSSFHAEESPPSRLELLAMDRADRLERPARALVRLHRVGDGPGPKRYALAVLELVAALRVAASGKWPPDVEGIFERMSEALAETEADTRRLARGVLRGHQLDTEALRAAGVGSLAARLTFESRHERAQFAAIIARDRDLF